MNVEFFPRTSFRRPTHSDDNPELGPEFYMPEP